MEAIEALAGQWIAEHPEYHAELSDVDAALARLGETDAQRDNPFLHLSMHLSISEQCSIDQPPGIRQAVELLTARRGDLHAAHHEVMECLGSMLWAGLHRRGAAARDERLSPTKKPLDERLFCWASASDQRKRDCGTTLSSPSTVDRYLAISRISAGVYCLAMPAMMPLERPIMPLPSTV